MAKRELEHQILSEPLGMSVRRLADQHKTNHWGSNFEGDWYLPFDNRELSAARFTRRDLRKMEKICPGITAVGDDQLAAAAVLQVLYLEKEDKRVISDAQALNLTRAVTAGQDRFDSVTQADMTRINKLLVRARQINGYISRDPTKEIFVMELIGLAALPDDNTPSKLSERSSPHGGIGDLIKRYIQFRIWKSDHRREDWFSIHGVDEKQFGFEIPEGQEYQTSRVLVVMDHMDGKIKNPRPLESLFRDVGPYFLGKVFGNQGNEIKIGFLTALDPKMPPSLRKLIVGISENYGLDVIDAATVDIDMIKKLRHKLKNNEILAASPEQGASGMSLIPAQDNVVKFAKLVGINQIVPVSTMEYIRDGRWRYRFIAHPPMEFRPEDDPKMVADAAMYILSRPYSRAERGFYGIEWLMKERGISQFAASHCPVIA